MALGPNEVMVSGFVRDSRDDLLVITTDTTGASVSQGYLRDSDGRLVVSFS